jgi:hypothetical protein
MERKMSEVTGMSSFIGYWIHYGTKISISMQRGCRFSALLAAPSHTFPFFAGWQALITTQSDCGIKTHKFSEMNPIFSYQI